MRRRSRLRRWRRWALPGFAAVTLALSGCGGDDDEAPAVERAPATTATPAPSASPSPGAEPTASATPAPSASPTATATAPPEEQPGGAGDEGAREFGRFTVTGNQIAPDELRVPARLGGSLAFEAADGEAHTITITPPLEGRSEIKTGETITVTGPRAGSYKLAAGEATATLIFE